MSRNLLVIAVAVTMLTVFFPATTATHFSVGYEGSVGHENLETPDDPSVVGEEEGAEDTPYGVGTNTTDCYEAEEEVSADQVAEAATKDGFCGDLVYNQGTGFEVTSPPDQEIIRDDLIGQFDVQRSWRTGSPAGYPNTCEPMCDDRDDEISIPVVGGSIDNPVPVQNTIWNAVHTAGSAAGLTDSPEDADSAEENRDNAYVVFAQNAHPTGIAQRETGVWEMNGWTVPAMPYGGGFIGFLYDNQGDFITGPELQEMIDGLVEDGDLSSDSEARICGFTPDRNFQGNFDQGFCEATMFYTNGEESNDISDGFRTYEDPCRSPTYVCGAATGGYYESQATGLAGAYAGRYQGEHMRWHWLVGPNEPDCIAQDPGVAFSGDAKGQDPYLAHDLDVYTPPQRLSTGPDTVHTDNLYSLDDGSDGYAEQFISGGTPSVPLVPEDQVRDEAEPVYREDMLEPNHVDPGIEDLDDDSRQAVNEERSLGEGCSELTTTETTDTIDPWVSYVDTEVDADRTIRIRDAVVEDNAAPAQGGVVTGQVGLYDTEDDHHDPDNDPTTDLYSTSGNVGMFTDKNDDGDYDVVIGPNTAASTFGMGVYDGERIDNIGAYPMLWDMHVNFTDEDEPQVDEEAGCTGPDGQDFAEFMKAAGYGPNTGLVQAIYLKEPTVFYDGSLTDPTMAPYPAGNNIYVLLSDAARDLWDGDVENKNGTALDAEVDNLIEDLEDYVVNNHDADPGTLEVHTPGEDLDLGNDFNNQCGTDTGGYSLDVSFTHSCEIDCSGDTIATKYVFELAREDGTIGGQGSGVPTFQIDGEDHTFGSGIHTWTDLDAFDGDADRNEQRMDPPPAEN